MKRLAERVEGFTPEAVFANEQFTSVVIQANLIATRTHQEEKLEALRNAVLNTALHPDIDADFSAMFLRLIDELSVSHARMLSFYNDPENWISTLGYGNKPGDFDAAFRGKLMPDYDNRHEFYMLVIKDLDRYGLVKTDDTGPLFLQNGVLTPNKANKSYTTDLGKQFVAFITSPLGE